MSNLTNQRVYQELVYWNKPLKEMITGSTVLAWVQAPHWGKKEKKIGVGEKHKSASETSREVVWGGDSLGDIFLI